MCPLYCLFLGKSTLFSPKVELQAKTAQKWHSEGNSCIDLSERIQVKA